MQVRAWLVVPALLLAPLAYAIPAQASPPPKAGSQGILTGAAGMTLYTYDPDGASGASHCTGPCAIVWPPYLADPGAVAVTGFGLVARPDHREQWSYQGRPLYRYAGDTKPDEALGEGVNGVWHVARTH